MLREQCTPYVSPVQALLAATEGQHVCGALGVVLSGEINSPLQPCCWACAPTRGFGPTVEAHAPYSLYCSNRPGSLLCQGLHCTSRSLGLVRLIHCLCLGHVSQGRTGEGLAAVLYTPQPALYFNVPPRRQLHSETNSRNRLPRGVLVHPAVCQG